MRKRLLQSKKPFIIGIAGDSGSGKTTYGNGIRRLLGKDLVKTIDMDGYHKENRKEREVSGHLPLDPKINNLDLLKNHLTQLKQGNTVEIPIYNHKTGDFDVSVSFSPPPIIIIEGLHALYPEFLPLLDFSIYVDPSREVKWQWKYQRDVEVRKHNEEELTKEMLKREAAYKRWIDFQKTDADVVIKIYPTKIKDFAKYELINPLPTTCFKVELMITPTKISLPTIPLPFDLSSLLDIKEAPFLFSVVPSKYWGKDVSVIHIDGVLSEETVKALEEHIVSYTGISPNDILQENLPEVQPHELFTPTQFAQLIILWRFLEQINHQFAKYL